MEISQKQKNIIESTASKIVVIASAAAGKSFCLVERIKFLLNSGIDPDHIVAITFTNTAAEEIRERIGEKWKGVFIGTVHSYANYLLRASGIDTSDILDEEQFDKLFHRIKNNPQCIQYVEHLLLDEAQDSNALQLEFLIELVQPKNYMLVGDPKQSIYRFIDATPEYIINLSKNPEVTTYDLNENYRNGKKILEYAKSIICLNGRDYFDTTIPMRGVEGQVIDVEYSPRSIARTIRARGEYGQWFVLARTNAKVDEICEYLKNEGVPYDTFKRSELTRSELNSRLQADTVKVLTIHAAKGLEAKYVIVIGARFYNIEEKCISYVAATRAKDLLVWTREPVKRKNMFKGYNNWEK